MLVTATDPVGAMYGTMFGGKAYKDALRFSWTKYLPQVERDLKLVEGAGLSSKK